MRDFQKIKKLLLDEYCGEKDREGKEIKAFLSGMNYLEDFLVTRQDEEYRLNEDVPANELLKHTIAKLHKEQEMNANILRENKSLKTTVEQLHSLSKNDKKKLKKDEYIHLLIEENEKIKRELDGIIHLYISKNKKIINIYI